jgi:aspartate carbamoyltransferase catalytic subunit
MPPLIEKLGVSTVYFDLCQALQQADVVMMLRVQTERISGGYTQFPSASEYARFWGLNSETASRLKKDAIIMHPGPYNEGVEISQEVASGPYSVILNQVQNGVLVRMALMDLIAGREVA